MIIRPDGDSLLFITQPDHARLAAILIAEWQDDGLPAHPRRESILLATREHDKGWREEDTETHVDASGRPLDFIEVAAAVKQRIWPRAVSRLASDHPYEAALVAQHAVTVNGDHRVNPDWSSFFETLDAQRAALLMRSGPAAAATIDADYAFVNIADRLSLIFCNGWREPFEHRGRRLVLTETMLRITPDPFDGAHVPLRVLARRLPVHVYASNADLRAALDEAPIEMLEGEALGDR
jgi:Protein of unknown function (DUF3891)